MSTVPQPRETVVALTGYHSAQVDVPVKLNTNESPYPPPHAFLNDWADAIRQNSWNRYPDREASALRSALAAHHGVAVDQVWAGNGSNEVLQALFLAYGGAGRSVMLFEPTYMLHRHIAEITGATILSCPRAEDFRIDPDRAVERIIQDAPNIVMLCSPNNPTGTVETAETVHAIAQAAAQVGALVIVDEAYGEFAPFTSIAAVTSNIAVVRTYSKVWSLAGLRLGFVVADPAVISAMIAVTLPYHLSAATQIGGVLALQHSTAMAARVDTLVAGRTRIESGLREIGVSYWPSGANFVLFRPVGDARAIWKELLDRGVLVRDCSGWSGCLRVTVGTSDENEAFLDALSRALGGQR